MVQLKDVLHLYIGGEVEVADGQVDDLKYYGVLESYAPRINEAAVRTSTGYTELTLIHFKLKEDKIKPILRPLSSMTKEEAFKVITLAKNDEDFIITYQGMGYSDFGKGFDHVVHDSVKCFKAEMYCEHPDVNTWLPAFLLQLDNEDCSLILGVFSDGGKELKDDVLDNQFQVTAYLLKQSFDLFNLIPSGQAIDATKHSTPTTLNNTDKG